MNDECSKIVVEPSQVSNQEPLFFWQAIKPFADIIGGQLNRHELACASQTVFAMLFE